MWIINYLLILLRECGCYKSLNHEGVGSINRMDKAEPSIHMGRGVVADNRAWSFEDGKKEALRKTAKRQSMLKVCGMPETGPKFCNFERPSAALARKKE